MTKSDFNEQIAKFTFQSASKSCVRLASFGGQVGSFRTDDGGYFSALAEELAHNDLIATAIAIRKLAEFETLNKIVRKFEVRKVGPLQLTPTKWETRYTGETISLWKVLNILIHSNLFEVVANDFQIKLLRGNSKIDTFELIAEARFKHEFKPSVIVGSKHEPLIMFQIIDLASVSMEFLDEAADRLSDSNVFIGNSKSD